MQEKREAKLLFEEQLAQREKDWKIRIESLESEALVHHLRVSSLTNETDKLREDRSLKSQIAESSENAQRRLENELKQSKWELEDYRAMCTRRIQDLESQISFSEQSQKSLVEKYERKLVQAEARLQETIDRNEKVVCGNNEHVNHLNNLIRDQKAKSSDFETELSRANWKIEDLTAEKTKLIEANAVEKASLREQIKILEDKDKSDVLQEEVNHIKKCWQEAKHDLQAKTDDVTKYQTELAAIADQLSEADRQKARLELDCQQKCETIQREQYEKSEKLISRLSQAKERAEATVKKLEKESTLHQQAISGLKKDRLDAYETLKSHGLTVQFSQQPSVSANGTSGEDARHLQIQNEHLKEAMKQMRQEMEGIARPGAHMSPRDASNSTSIYVKSLEDEIKDLKQQLRQKELVSSKHVSTTGDLVEAAHAGGGAGVKKVVLSLNATIASLRSEKVELMATSRKHQVELESLRTELRQVKQKPHAMQIELEQAKYELNSTTRRLHMESSSYKQHIAELETNVESTREEAAEYHRNLLSANADNQVLSTELSTLRMAQARSENVINYGAQELMIQNLQDEVSLECLSDGFNF